MPIRRLSGWFFDFTGAPSTVDIVAIPSDRMPLRWSLAHGVQIAFSARIHGDQRNTDLRRAFSGPLVGDRRLVVPRQIHGITIVDEQADAERLLVADGVVATDPQVAIGAYGADCPGVVIAAPDAIGIAHCGWRGSAAGLATRLVHAVGLRSVAPRHTWQAFIGPGIGGPSYEVDEMVLRARQWPPSAVEPSPVPGRAYLDLAIALGDDLRGAGIPLVRSSGLDTAGDERLHSYRHHGAGLVQMLVAWRG